MCREVVRRELQTFAALGDLVVTGPTRTNVNDFRAILISPEAAFRGAKQ